MNTTEKQKNNNKTRCPKTTSSAKPEPAGVVAEVVGCAPSLVVQVRSGERNANTPTGKAITVADILITEGKTALLAKVKQLIKAL